MSTFVLPGTGLPALADREFRLFQRLIHQQAGIWLADTKRALLVGRLARRLRALGVTSFADYHGLVERDPAELVRLLDAIATNETSFFREPLQMDCLADRLCPAWERDAAAGLRTRRLRVWSAACSSGEEPYTLGMLLHDRLASLGWAIEILATDLSTRMLAHAEAGVFEMKDAGGIPAQHLRRYWLEGNGPEAGRVRIGSEVRGLVRFDRLNLHAEAWKVNGSFDAIFCRNVLIYFDLASRHQVLRRLLGHVAPGGYLFLGHAESLAGMDGCARSVMPAVYRVAEPKAACA